MAMPSILKSWTSRAANLGEASPALERAIRQSELIRIRVIIAFVFIFMGSMVFRGIVTMDPRGLLPQTTVALLILGYEFLVYRAAARAAAENRSLPVGFWRLNAAIECFFPTLGMIEIAHSGAVPPQDALVFPGIQAYGFFILVLTLSLRPSVSVIGGAACSLYYAVMMAYIFWRFDVPPGEPLPFFILSVHPFGLFTMGLAGAGVAYRVRSHVLAEIREAQERESVESELDVASRIQRGLLPLEAPALPGYAIAGWNQPAEHTGGDYYDWQVLPDRNVAVMLADVSGHGLGPALVAAFCRAYTRASLQHHDELAVAVENINGLVREDMPNSWFITFVAAVLRPDEDGVELMSAGHGPIYHYVAARREIVSSGADGIPLGIDDTVHATDARLISLAAGDLLVLVTDGFQDWDNISGERFGAERLSASLSKHAGEAPAKIIDAVREDLRAFTGDTPQPDDLTIVVIKRVAT